MILPIPDMQPWVAEAAKVLNIPVSASEAYWVAMPGVVARVTEAMSAREDIRRLIGGNPLPRMAEHHQYIASFMGVVFQTRSEELLARNLPWIYRTNITHGFSAEYFPVELREWMRVLRDQLPPGLTHEILGVYEWMLQSHEYVLELSTRPSPVCVPEDPEFSLEKKMMLSRSLAGDHPACLAVARELASRPGGLQNLYLRVIQPCMEEIGKLWESGRINVSHEHLATAVIIRVMSATSSMDFSRLPPKGKAVITPSPGDSHEIAAWMISDLMERNGWDVRYLGANAPAEDMLILLEDFKPKVIIISVTLSSNIRQTTEFITQIHARESLRDIHILVGGQAFGDIEALWRSTGADACCRLLSDILPLADTWGLHAHA